MTPEQTTRIEEILKQWHEAGRSYFEKAYTNLQYDSVHYIKSFKEGGKYVKLDQGGEGHRSGYYMVELATGNVYAIKAYGVPNKKKILGNAWSPTFNGAVLDKMRGVHGNYDLR
jgi:hypothetical protein